MTRVAILIFFSIIISACGGEGIYVPKPRMYPKVDFPEKTYQVFDQSYCDLQFEYPEYATIEQDLYFFDERPENPCWFTIQFPELNGSLHCSYIEITSRSQFDDLVNDSYEIASKHNIKANYRDELKLVNPNGVHGLMFDISGEVASHLQFFLTDTTEHFFQGLPLF